MRVLLLLACLCAAARPADASSCKPLPPVTVTWEESAPGADPVAVIRALAPGRHVVLTVRRPDGSEAVAFRGTVDPDAPVRVAVAAADGTLVADARVTSDHGAAFRVGARLPGPRSRRPLPEPRLAAGATGYAVAPLSAPAVGPARAPQQISVDGVFRFRDRAFDETGFVNDDVADDPRSPVRRAVVALLRNGAVVAEDVTGEDGSYSFAVEAVAGAYRVRVSTATDPAGAPRIRVRTNTGATEPFHAFTVETVLAEPADLDFGTSLIEAGSGGEAFNILDGALAGADLATELSGFPPAPECILNWNASSQVGSFYSSSGNSIFLLDEEGYDDSVIIHEYGHYVADQYNGYGWPGGAHFVDDANQNPILSFSEGFASYWQSATRLREGSDTPTWYVDTSGEPGGQNLFFSYDCEEPSFGVRGAASEVVVQGTLWDLIDGADTPDPFPGTDDDPLELDGSAVWTAYTSTAFGSASTPTLEDYWDAWFSPGVDGGEEEGLRAVFTALGMEFYADNLEPDDADGQATPLPVDGSSVHHSFHPAGDTDMHRLELVAGQTATVETNNTIAHSDTRIRVRDPQGSLVGDNDDRGPGDISSSVTFTAETGGTFLVEITKVSKGNSALLDYGSYDVRAVLGEVAAVPLLERAASLGVADQNFSVGAGWADYDGDGDPDLFVVSNPGAGTTAGRDVLYQYRPGSFVDATGAAGLGGAEGGVAPAWGDIDNDGDPDLFATDHVFWRNEGDGTFTDMTGAAGVDDRGREFDAEFVDVDGDGYLDLFVTVRDAPSALWMNDGDGTFTEGAAEAGLSFPAGGGEAHGCAWGDYDDDGDPDLFLAYRSAAGHALFRNDGGTFTEVTGAAGVASTDPAVGVLWADLTGDGRLDAYVCSDLANKLYRNDGDGTFTDVAARYGVDHGGTSRGAAAVDYDLDGDLDLFVVQFNGNNRLHQNLVDSMVQVSEAGLPGFGHAAGWADYDGDGDPDLFVARQLESNLFFRSSATGSGRGWLHLDLVGTESNRDGIGAVVRLYSGDAVYTRHRGTGTGWAGSSLVPEMFGVPAAGVDSVTVDWPSGRRTLVLAPAAGQRIEVSEDQTVPVRPDPAAGALLRAVSAAPNPFRGASAVRFRLDRSAAVSLTVLDVRGRVVRAVDGGRLPAGEHVLGWDGADDSGRSAAAGVYFFRLRADGAAEVRKVVRLD